MKYTIAIAAILGMAQGFAVLDKFGNMQVIEERAPLSDTQLLQDDDYSEVPASMIGSPSASGYERPMPEEFSAERDDRLMNSLIGKYAREVKRDGNLTGALFCNKDDAFAVHKTTERCNKKVPSFSRPLCLCACCK